jgi:hypothetical protein
MEAHGPLSLEHHGPAFRRYARHTNRAVEVEMDLMLLLEIAETRGERRQLRQENRAAKEAPKYLQFRDDRKIANSGATPLFSGGFDRCLNASRDRAACWGEGRESLRPPSVHRSPNQSA